MKRFMIFAVFIVAPILCVIGLASLSPSAVKDEPGPFENKRAIFEEDIFWTDPQRADRMLADISEAGFNVLVVNVWHGRGTIWPSQLAPRDPWVAKTKDAAFDPLAYLIREAGKVGIEVHAWFTISLRQMESFKEFWPEGTPDKAFDIHHSGFQTLMADLIGEVVERYDVKGINLDYIRTLGFCRSAICQDRYRQAYRRDLVKDIQTFESIPGGVLKQAVVPDLVEFQEAAVTSMLTVIVKRIRSVHPSLLLSIDALPGEIGLEQGQNSIKWLNDGLVDVVFRMDYALEPNVKLLEKLRTQLTRPNSLTLLLSNILQEKVGGERRYSPRSGEWLATTVDHIDRRWPAMGIGVYMSKYLSKDQIAHLRNGPGSFPDHVPPPAPRSIVVE